MTRSRAGVRASITRLCLLPLVVGLAGCASSHVEQGTDLRLEDSRTAERVRETLAAGPDYKYDGVKVTVVDGVVRLTGSVDTPVRKSRAGEVAGRVVGVKQVENGLSVGH
jgi:osmotically-inducible protein OsmY